jgi:uncharacterized protein
MDDAQRQALEAAAFRQLLAHLRDRSDVQNLDLMNLAGFCRNCLAKWLKAAGEDLGQPLDYEQCREWVYGMPYEQWKAQHQLPATPEQQAAFDRHQKH